MRKDLDDAFQNFATKLDLAEALEDVDEKNRGYRDQILNGLDKVVKELETMREENLVGAHQIEEMYEKVESHEKRITKLESPSH